MQDGTLWEVGVSYQYLYAYFPSVVICPSAGELRVDGRTIPVTQVRNFIESRISGEFDGFDGDKLFSLTNGQIWIQAEYRYHYHYAYRPSVIVFESSTGVRIKVEGVDGTVRVQLIH